MSCNDNVYYYYNPAVVEEYSNYFDEQDSIKRAEDKAIYILDSIEEAKNDSIY